MYLMWFENKNSVPIADKHKIRYDGRLQIRVS